MQTARSMHQDIDRVLVTKKQIADRVSEMAEELSSELMNIEGDSEIVLLPIMTGSVIFVADLMRQLPMRLRIDVVTVSSYPGMSKTSQGAMLRDKIPESIRGQHVLVVDDILDSGSTIRLIRSEVERIGVRSVRSCMLLRKTIPSAMETPCEYVGFDIPDEFVVGYGLDYNGYYRNLPDICVLKADVQ